MAFNESSISKTVMPAPHVNLMAISVGEIVAREALVQWDEAVAVVQELCDLLTAAGQVETPVPELAAIFITADGHVRLQPGGRSEKGVAGAGRTLHALLSSATNVPVSLRLLVTQSISTEAYSALRAFADALAYFGKPMRTELIRGLYERCAARVTSPVPTMSATTPDQIRKPEERSAPREKSTARKKSRILARSAAVAALATLLGIGAWLLTRPTPGSAGIPSVPALVARAKSALESLATEVRSVVGVGDASASLAGDEIAAGSPAPVAERRTRRANASDKRVQPDDAQIVASPQESPVQPADLGVPASDDLSHGESESETDIAMRDAAVAAQRTETVYSDSDMDVQPPSLLYPQLPPPILTGRQSQAVNTMELIVSEDGKVERVRLINGPRRMTDMMLLSGAKMWKFEPALRNGMRVRYRTIVAWMGVP